MRGTRPHIDLALAKAQHAAYEKGMSAIGFSVRTQGPLDDHPDACFVEDVALLLPEVAVILRPGAPERREETAAIVPVVSELSANPIQLNAPARIDGGDVLPVGRTIYVGLSGRTDEAGVAALREIVAPHGYEVRALPVRRGLHLRSMASATDDLVVAEAGAVDADALGHPVLFVEGGANFVWNDGAALVPASSMRVADLLAARGARVVSVDLSEFEKGDAGATCLSLRECSAR